MSRRIAIIGDVHAEDELLERALAHCREHADRICCVGDIADGRGNVSRCCTLLLEYDVHTVRGNHDRWLLGGKLRILPDATALGDISIHARAFLQGLPPVLEFETRAGPLLLCHGLGSNDMAGVRPHDEAYALYSNTDLWKLVNEGRFRFVANGHTHRRMVRSFGGLTIVNAGTLAREHQPGFTILDTETLRVSHFEFDGEQRPVQAVEVDIDSVSIESREPV